MRRAADLRKVVALRAPLSPLINVVSIALHLAIVSFAGAAAPRIHFDQPRYVVSTNESFEISILIDGDDTTMRDDILSHGLFSYGVLVEFDPASARANEPVIVPAELGYFGFDEGAYQESRSGSIGVKGNINRQAGADDVYEGNLLARVSVTNLAPPSSEYEIGLSLFRTLGPTEQIFLDGKGQALDTMLGFESAHVSVAGGVAGDVNGDGQLTARDIDLFCEILDSGEPDLAVDFNRDQRVDPRDLQHWVEEIKKTYMGDANLDGEFNSTDLVAVFTVGEYEDTIRGNSTWAEGDWNCDGEFSTGDIVVAFRSGGFELGRRDAVAAFVPEPCGGSLILLGVASLLFSCKRYGLMRKGPARGCVC